MYSNSKQLWSAYIQNFKGISFLLQVLFFIYCFWIGMPFHKRTLEPQNLCRLNTGPLKSDGGQSHFELDHCSVFSSQLWTSLNDVSCTSLKNLLQQLSDLSHHACSIFLEIQSEATSVLYRSTVLQRRLDTLQHTVRKLDHKKIRIRKSFNLDSSLGSIL